jgi:hypothetical protein
MVNNSTNINKTNESLNSDGQQFYQYQHNEQPPLTSKHRTHHSFIDIAGSIDRHSFIDIAGNIDRHSFIDIPRSIDHHSLKL